MDIIWIILIILIVAVPVLVWFFRKRIKTVLNRGTYRNVEKNVFVGMPEQMPKEYIGREGVKIHANSPPTPREIENIYNAIDRQIKRFEQPFRNFQPADFGQKAKLFKKHSEYRIWLLEHPTSIVGAESEEIKGFPIIRTHNSATGYASGITAGFKMLWGGGIEPVYPFIVVPRLVGQWMNDDRANAYQVETLQNEVDHLLASNSAEIWNYFAQNDIHPFEW